MNVFRKWQEKRKRKRKRQENAPSQPTPGAPNSLSVPACDDVPEQKIHNPEHDVPELNQPPISGPGVLRPSLQACDPSDREPTPQIQENTRSGESQAQFPGCVVNVCDSITSNRPPGVVEDACGVQLRHDKQSDSSGGYVTGPIRTCYRCLGSLSANPGSPERCACPILPTEDFSSAPGPVSPTTSTVAALESLPGEYISSKPLKDEQKALNSEPAPVETSDNELAVPVQTRMSALGAENAEKETVNHGERQAVQPRTCNSSNTELPDAELLWAQFYDPSIPATSNLVQPDVKSRSEERNLRQKQTGDGHIPGTPISKLHNDAIALIVELLDYTSTVFLKISCKYFYKRVQIPSTTPSNKDKFRVLHTFAPKGSTNMILCHLCQKWHRKNCYPSVKWSPYLRVNGGYRNLGVYLLCKGGTTRIEDGTKCLSCTSRANTHMPIEVKELFGTRQPCPWCTEPPISIEWGVCCVDCFKEEREKSIDTGVLMTNSQRTTAHEPTVTQTTRSNVVPSAEESYVASRLLRGGKATHSRTPPWTSQGYPTSSAYQSTVTNEMRSWGIIPTRPDSQRMRSFGKSSSQTTSYRSQGWGMGYSSTCGRCLGTFYSNPESPNMCLCNK